MDQVLFDMIQSLAGISPIFDRVISNIAANPVLKGIPPMLLFWSLWHRAGAKRQATRTRLLATLGVTTAALAVGRLVSTILPFRLRPLHTPDVQMHLSFDIDTTALSGWSALPSDHAVMFFALAACLWRINRLYGALALLHATIAVAFGRIFLGYHWPMDILSGAVIGVATAMLMMPVLARLFARRRLVRRVSRVEHLAYPVLFFATFQIATMFDGLRDLAAALVRAASL